MRELRAGYIDGTQPFLTLLNFKGDIVALFKFVESDTVEIFRVEEEVLRLAFASDETKSPIRQSLYSSCHIFVFVFLLLLFLLFEKTDLFSLVSRTATIVTDSYTVVHKQRKGLIYSLF